MTTEHKPHITPERIEEARAWTNDPLVLSLIDDLVEQYEQLNALHANGMFLGRPIEYWEGLQEQQEVLEADRDQWRQWCSENARRAEDAEEQFEGLVKIIMNPHLDLDVAAADAQDYIKALNPAGSPE